MGYAEVGKPGFEHEPPVERKDDNRLRHCVRNNEDCETCPRRDECDIGKSLTREPDGYTGDHDSGL